MKLRASSLFQIEKRNKKFSAAKTKKTVNILLPAVKKCDDSCKHQEQNQEPKTKQGSNPKGRKDPPPRPGRNCAGTSHLENYEDNGKDSADTQATT